MLINTITLLIVEDLATDRELYRRALSQESSCIYDVLEAESVAQGLTLCRTGFSKVEAKPTIDAILLDYKLPDGDGLEFLAALNAQSNGSSPPVVMVTGMSDPRTAVKAMKLGAEDYLVKSDLTPELLRSTMRMAIENARLRLQLQQSQSQAELTLQAKNQQITTIWESMTDAYITVDLQWRIVYANSAATQVVSQLVGLTPEEFLGKTHWEVFPWSVGNIVEQEYRRAVTDQAAVHFEVLYEPTEIWFEIHAYPSEIGLGIYFQDINERKQSEAARIQAERERDQFFELSLDLLAIANLDSYFVRLNPAWEQTLGFTTAELTAKPYLDFVHPDDRAETLATAQGLSRGQTVIRFENRYLCKDGSYRWLSWSSRPYDEQNLVYAVAYDITQQKRDEELLRQSEELKRRILESSRDCIKVVDLQGRLIYMNDYGQSLMEIDDFSTVAGSQWLEFWQGSEREAAQTALSTALAGGVNRFDGSSLTAKGTPKWWEVIVTPILDADGRVSQILSVSRDINDRKRMEAARLSAEQERDRFFSQSIDLLAIGNFEGYFVRINPAFERLLGFTETEFVSRPFIDFVHPDDREATLAAAQSLAEEVIIVDFENRCQCKDGSDVWVSWTATPYQQSNCWYGVGRDITLRKQTQADLEQRNQDLASFAYVVSHDLKTPLRGIANLSEWIEEDFDGSLSVANQQQMTLLRSRIYKMEATIDGLLDYARVGISVETIESVSIAELLADVIDSIAPPPTFTIELPPELPILSTRRLPLFQVFANLIGNGIKHHDAEDGSIQISSEDRGDCYEFAIADDGPGIAPEHHDRMFKIFQAVNPQKRSDSTGIGLAIVKKIVEAEGGTIWLESELGKGTTFYFTWLHR
jgi:PAS domain S-box-containing protein